MIINRCVSCLLLLSIYRYLCSHMWMTGDETLSQVSFPGLYTLLNTFHAIHLRDNLFSVIWTVTLFTVNSNICSLVSRWQRIYGVIKCGIFHICGRGNTPNTILLNHTDENVAKRDIKSHPLQILLNSQVYTRRRNPIELIWASLLGG